MLRTIAFSNFTRHTVPEHNIVMDTFEDTDVSCPGFLCGVLKDFCKLVFAPRLTCSTSPCISILILWQLFGNGPGFAASTALFYILFVMRLPPQKCPFPHCAGKV